MNTTDNTSLAERLSWVAGSAHTEMTTARCWLEPDTDGMVSLHRMERLLKAQADYRLYVLLERTIASGASAYNAVREVVKECERVLRRTGTTTGALDRAAFEYDRHAAVRFLERWEHEV